MPTSSSPGSITKSPDVVVSVLLEKRILSITTAPVPLARIIKLLPELLVVITPVSISMSPNTALPTVKLFHILVALPKFNKSSVLLGVIS